MAPRVCIILLILPLVAFPALSQSNKPTETELQNMFIEATTGATLIIPAGFYELSRSLWLDGGKDITIKGDGLDQTILSFRNQKDGAEGIKVTNGTRIRIAGLTVQDTKGDGIKVQDTQGITFYEVKAEWTGKPGKDNGAYGLYPVLCSDVLIDKCVAIGASDAGIYVGQSNRIVVRNSTAYHNVAGIEIENSFNADIYDNLVHGNTGGLLVFDLPDLIQKKGGNVRVYNNIVKENNYTNFAPKGNAVGKVPPGTGVMILATNHVEVFGNEIINNRSVSTAIISYFMTEEPIKDTAYYPYPNAISIHDNIYERKPVRTTFEGRMGKLLRLKLRFGKNVPHIIYDGIVDKKLLVSGKVPTEKRVCIRNNKGESFANIDAENDFKNISRDISKHNCSLPELNRTELVESSYD